MNEPSKESIELAAQCWCDDETKHIEMNPPLAIAFAKRLDAARRIMRVEKKEWGDACRDAGFQTGFRTALFRYNYSADEIEKAYQDEGRNQTQPINPVT